MSYSIHSQPRSRWNVLDLITYVARGSVPATIFRDVDMSWCEQLRRCYAEHGEHLTFTAVLLKAMAIAQRDHPLSRSVVIGNKLAVLDDITAGITIERVVDCQPSVFFGTIADPGTRPLVEIMHELEAYSKARISEHPVLNTQFRFSQMPRPIRRMILWLGMHFLAVRQKYMGASFGFTSLGKFGVTGASGPTTCTSTFAIGTVEKRVVARAGKLEIRPVMTLSLVFDCRVMTGSEAARYLSDVVELVEGSLVKYIDTQSTLKTGNQNGATESLKL